MATEPETTPETEPGDAPTSVDGPESEGATDSTSEAPPQSDAREERLRANREGHLMEALRQQREENARLSGMWEQSQRQVPHQQAAPQQDDEEALTEAEATQLYQATAVGDIPAIRRLENLKAERIVSKSAKRFTGVLSSINAQAESVNAITRPFSQMDWNSPLGKETINQYNRLASDMNVVMPQGKWHPVVARMAFEAAGARLDGQRRTSREDNNHEDARTNSAEHAGPAQKKVQKERMYFKTAEKKAIHHWAKIDRISEEAEQKKVWDRLPASERQARQARGRAE